MAGEAMPAEPTLARAISGSRGMPRTVPFSLIP